MSKSSVSWCVDIITVDWFQVILAGKKETVSLAIQKAERFRTELLQRGVLLVPVIWGQAKAQQITKKGFGNRSKPASSLPSIGVRLRKSHTSCVALPFSWELTCFSSIPYWLSWFLQTIVTKWSVTEFGLSIKVLPPSQFFSLIWEFVPFFN